MPTPARPHRRGAFRPAPDLPTGPGLLRALDLPAALALPLALPVALALLALPAPSLAFPQPETPGSTSPPVSVAAYTAADAPALPQAPAAPGPPAGPRTPAAPGPSAVPQANAPAGEAERLRRSAAEIRRLLEGSLPEEFPVQTLFEVNLLNEEAVEIRRRDLAGITSELTADLARARAAPRGKRGPEGPDPELLALRLELARLRLAFLQRPLAERLRVNEAEERRRRLERQQEEARLAQRAAEEEAREAERARRLAAERAALTASALQASIAEETARIESMRAVLASLAADLASRKARETEQARKQLQAVLRLEQQARKAAEESEEADSLYGEIVDQLREARAALREVLALVRQRPRAPRFEPRLDPGTIGDPAATAELRQRIADLEERARALEREMAAALWRAVELRAERATRLDAARLDLLPRLSPDARSRILGITREGIAQLRREVEHLALLSGLYLATRIHALDLLPAALRDIFTLGLAAYTLLKVVLLIALAILLARRGPGLLERLRRALFRHSRSRVLARNLSGWLSGVRSVWPQAVFLAAVWSVGTALGEAAAWPEVDVAYTVLLAYAVYRLAIQVLHSLAMEMAARYVTGISPALSARVLETVRTLARVVLAIVVFLALCERFLGRGYLYGVASELGWVAIAAALLVLLQRWRGEICDAYLRISPEGRLAGLVRATRDRWQGFFAALLSFLVVALRALLTLARDTALRFDQTRKGLAFLFRRRMERRAEESGYADVDLGAFPPQVRQAFSEEPLEDDRLGVDRFPGLERLRAALERSAHGGSGGSFLLYGEHGHGKTSWLNRALREPGAGSAVRIDLSERVLDPRELVARLQRALGEPEGDGMDLRRRLSEGPRRVVVIDQCQNLMLRAVGGYMALDELFDMLEVTQRRVFWICSFNHHVWLHITALRGHNHPFLDMQTLPAWDEEGIRELIRRRTQRSGLTLSYEDLLVERLEGVTEVGRILETEQGYTRLLWDYSDGNPRVAIHFWLRSLVPDGAGSARVRLFRAPEVGVLEALMEIERFLLAAVMAHENLTVGEAAHTTRYPDMACEGGLARLRDRGVLGCDAGGRYRVSTHWHRAVVRFLKRVNLLVD